MEFSSPLSQFAQAANAARASQLKPPDPTRIKPGGGAARAGTDPNTMSRNGANSALIRAATPDSRPAANSPGADPDRPAGPPPAFDISVLERALDFERIMARHEAERNQPRDAAAIRPENDRAGAALPTPHAQAHGQTWAPTMRSARPDPARQQASAPVPVPDDPDRQLPNRPRTDPSL